MYPFHTPEIAPVVTVFLTLDWDRARASFVQQRKRAETALDLSTRARRTEFVKYRHELLSRPTALVKLIVDDWVRNVTKDDGRHQRPSAAPTCELVSSPLFVRRCGV